VTAAPMPIKPASGRLLPISVQLVFARQSAKEQGKSD